MSKMKRTPKKRVMTAAADHIRAEMARQQVTVDDLWARTGISPATISDTRAGRNVKVSTLETVCVALGLEIKIERAAA